MSKGGGLNFALRMRAKSRHVKQKALADRLTFEQGRLRECIVIIRTMYEDLKAGKRMAKYFLESQGYRELVNYLDEKSTK